MNVTAGRLDHLRPQGWLARDRPAPHAPDSIVLLRLSCFDWLISIVLRSIVRPYTLAAAAASALRERKARRQAHCGYDARQPSPYLLRQDDASLGIGALDRTRHGRVQRIG